MMCQADDGNLGEDGVAPEGALQSIDGGEAMERGEAYWTYDSEAGAWYFGLKSKAAPPYLTQRHFDAIVDLDAEGRLAGIELLQPLLPSRGTWSPRSPDEEAVPADTVSAASSEGSLTPQDYEAKASELYEISWRSTTSQEAVAAISSALSTAFEEGRRVERERIETIVTAVMDECSANMHKHFAREQDTLAEAFRLRMEGAARVAQKLGMLVPVDDDPPAIRQENDNGC